MARTKRIILTVRARPRHRTGKLYGGMIKQADIGKESKWIKVTIENLDPSQSGRMYEITLPSKLFLGSKTTRFLAAASVEADTVGKRICLNDIVGVIIGMRFSDPNSDIPSEFVRISKPSSTEPKDTTTEPTSQTDSDEAKTFMS